MAKQSYTVGQVLTSAQMSALQLNDYNQTVSTKTASYTLVAADAGTKIVMNSASATTITVNTSLFAAGDTLTILNIGAGVCTITAGTATVSSAGTLALVQNAGGTLYFTSAGVSVFQANGVAAGLVPVVPTSVAVGSGSATTSALGQVTLSAVGTSVSLNGVFSASYTNYKVIYRTTLSTPSATGVRLRVAGVDSSSSDYLKNGNIVEFGANYPSSVAATTSWGLSGTGTINNTAVFDLLNPFSAAVTFGFGMFDQSSATIQSDFGTFSLLNKATTSYDGLTILISAGTATGTVSVYGYAI